MPIAKTNHLKTPLTLARWIAIPVALSGAPDVVFKQLTLRRENDDTSALSPTYHNNNHRPYRVRSLFCLIAIVQLTPLRQHGVPQSPC
jgi:hypothetical protein